MGSPARTVRALPPFFLLALPKKKKKKYTGSASPLDLLLGDPAEELGFYDHGLLGEDSLAQDLVVTSSNNINNGCLVLDIGVLLAGLFGDEGPQLVELD